MGILPLTASSELILNSSTNPIVMAVGCEYGLIPTRLTSPVMEKWGDGVTVTFDLFCLADTPTISWLTKLQPYALALLHYPRPTNTHTHISFFILTLTSDARERWRKGTVKRWKIYGNCLFLKKKTKHLKGTSFMSCLIWGCLYVWWNNNISESMLKASVYSATFLIVSVCNQAFGNYIAHQPSCPMAAQMPPRPASHQCGSSKHTLRHSSTWGHTTHSCCKGTFCSCGDFTNRLVFFTLEIMTWSRATLTTLGPFNHTHPPIHTWNEMFMAEERGSRGFVLGVFREEANKHLTAPHHSKDSVNATQLQESLHMTHLQKACSAPLKGSSGYFLFSEWTGHCVLFLEY